VRAIVLAINNANVVWVWVADAVAANTFHNATIKTVKLFETSHVVICTVVDSANLWVIT
jgi:hypothetical protein